MSGGYGSHDLVESLRWGNPLLKRLVKALYPPMPTLNIMGRSKIEALQARLFRSGAIVINVGSGGLSGCGYRLWQNDSFRAAQVYHLDILSGDRVSLVGDAHCLPLRSESVDSLIYQAVLEHVPDPRRVIEEAARVLKPGGYLYLEVPFLQGFHADPCDFQRYTLEGLRIRTRAFAEIEAGVSVGPFCTLVWIIRDGVSSCFTNPVLYAASRFAAGWLLSPIRYLDYLIRNNPAARRLACEYYFLCQKPL